MAVDLRLLIEVGVVVFGVMVQFAYFKFTLNNQGERIKQLEKDNLDVAVLEKTIIKLEARHESLSDNSNRAITGLEMSLKDLEKWVENKLDNLEKKIERNHIQLINKLDEIKERTK